MRRRWMDKANDAIGALSHAPAPTLQPGQKTHGRGSHSNASGRYERFSRVLADDGWGVLDEDAPPRRTVVHKDASRTVITRNQSPDISFDRSINPYRGCEHGCIYCFARPTHAYLGLSPGLDFESVLYTKPHAAALLEEELRRKDYKVRPIALGTNTDPYQPLERTHKITRSILEVLSAYRHPATIVTKSNLVTRDIDILGPMAERGLVKVAISVTTLDRKLARRMEPRAPTPERRLEAIELLARAGIPTGVMVAPVIPALTDHEIEAILARAAEAGASAAGYIALRMPLEIKQLFREWLTEHYPDRGPHVIARMQDMRGGKDYDAAWGRRMVGSGEYAKQISQRFRVTARRLGLERPAMDLNCKLFKPPPRPGDQMALL
ncbi:MAG: PA0069 family radical SAM protein [Alphaproteobacteria bacterium]|nr:MAG: PA0069 family radical SAM protein [Alphaproteobacteria bacterium]